MPSFQTFTDQCFAPAFSFSPRRERVLLANQFGISDDDVLGYLDDDGPIGDPGVKAMLDQKRRDDYAAEVNALRAKRASERSNMPRSMRHDPEGRRHPAAYDAPPGRGWDIALPPWRHPLAPDHETERDYPKLSDFPSEDLEDYEDYKYGSGRSDRDDEEERREDLPRARRA